jgi:hypothetical protein
MPWVAKYEKTLGLTFAVPTSATRCSRSCTTPPNHRGQINARLRTLGAQPPLVDYIGWIWFGKPRAEWA